MTRDELLDFLRRELSSAEWAELRPDDRLAELESRLDRLSEEITDLRRNYDDDSTRQLLRALDDLAASASYLRNDIAHLFSDATRLASDLRRALRLAEEDERPEQLGLSADNSSGEVGAVESEGGDESKQRQLFE